MKVNTLQLTVLLVGGVVALMILVLLYRKCKRKHRFDYPSCVSHSSLLSWLSCSSCRCKCECCHDKSAKAAATSTVTAAASGQHANIQILVTSESNDRFFRARDEIETSETLFDCSHPYESHNKQHKPSLVTLDSVSTSRTVSHRTVRDEDEGHNDARKRTQRDIELATQLNYQEAKSEIKRCEQRDEQRSDEYDDDDDEDEDEETQADADQTKLLTEEGCPNVDYPAAARARSANPNSATRSSKASNNATVSNARKKTSTEYVEKYIECGDGENINRFRDKVRSNEQANQKLQDDVERGESASSNRRKRMMRDFTDRSTESHRTIDSGELTWRNCSEAQRVRDPAKRTSKSLVYRRPQELAKHRSNDTDSDQDESKRFRIDASTEESLKLWSMRAKIERDVGRSGADGQPELSAVSSVDSADDKRQAFTPIFEESAGELTDGGQTRPASTRRRVDGGRQTSFSTDRRELFRALSKKRRQQRDARAAASHATTGQNMETSFESGETADSTTDSIRPATTTSMESNTVSTPDSVSQTNCGYFADDRPDNDVTRRAAVRHNSHRLRVRPVHALESVASCEREAGDSEEADEVEVGCEEPLDNQDDDNGRDQNRNHYSGSNRDDEEIAAIDQDEDCDGRDRLVNVCNGRNSRPLTLQQVSQTSPINDHGYSPSRQHIVDSACLFASSTRYSPSGRAYSPSATMSLSPDRSNWRTAIRNQLRDSNGPVDHFHTHSVLHNKWEWERKRDLDNDELLRSPNSTARRRMLPKLPPRRYDSDVNEQTIEERLVGVHKQPAAKCRSINTAESERYSRYARASDLCPPPPPTPSPSLIHTASALRKHHSQRSGGSSATSASSPQRYADPTGCLPHSMMAHKLAGSPESRRTTPSPTTANNNSTVFCVYDSFRHSNAEYTAAMHRAAVTPTRYHRFTAVCDGAVAQMQNVTNLTINNMIPRKRSN